MSHNDMENNVLLDFNQICRTCLSTGELISIFCRNNMDNVKTDMLLSEMLMECSSIQILEEDGLPSHMCTDCIKEMTSAYIFRQLSSKSDKTLHSYVDMRKLPDNYKFKLSPDNRSNSDIDTYEFSNINANEDSINNSVSEKLNDNIDNNVFKYKNSRTKNNNKVKVILTSTENTTNNSKQVKNKPRKRKSSHPVFKCRKCKEIFPSEADLKEHTKTKKHPDRQIPCTVCSKLLGSRNMYIHMRTHTKEKPYVCSFCNARFSANGNYRRHLMTHTGQRPHRCGVCDKGFIRAVSLEWHMRVHTGERPFVCFCGKAYKQSIQLKTHAKKHIKSEDKSDEKSENDSSRRSKTGRLDDAERTHICGICKRGFTTKMILSTHLLTHGDKKFLCSDCGKQFHTRMGLDTHIKVHNGKKPYICNICGKTFAYKASLKKHTYVHTGEKPYACKICDKKFSQSSHLRTHIRLHSGIKPYSCSICSKNFTLKGNLTVHMRIHMGEKPFTCVVCGKGFYDSSSLKKHRNRHGDKTVQNLFTATNISS